MVNHLKEEGDTASSGSQQKLAIFFTCMTFILTTVAVGLQLVPSTARYMDGTYIEGGICVGLIFFWVFTVAIITDAKYGIAVNDEGAVSNGNLYYFSWAGFVCSVTLAISYLQSAFQVDVTGEIRTRASRLTNWSALLTFSLVVMGCSVNIYSGNCTGDDTYSATYCRRTKFGIALGTLTTILSLLVVASKVALRPLPFMAEAITGLISTVMYIFGVCFITTQNGPGAPLGNLYYFTWLSFLISGLITASCYEDYQGVGKAPENTQEDKVNDDEDIEVENLDDV